MGICVLTMLSSTPTEYLLFIVVLYVQDSGFLHGVTVAVHGCEMESLSTDGCLQCCMGSALFSIIALGLAIFYFHYHTSRMMHCMASDCCTMISHGILLHIDNLLCSIHFLKLCLDLLAKNWNIVSHMAWAKVAALTVGTRFEQVC